MTRGRVAVVTGAAGGIGANGSLVHVTWSRAVDHGPGGVRVTCLCTGLIGTGLIGTELINTGLVDTEMADWIRHDEEALERWAADGGGTA